MQVGAIIDKEACSLEIVDISLCRETNEILDLPIAKTANRITI
jgi:hypothetical protein